MQHEVVATRLHGARRRDGGSVGVRRGRGIRMCQRVGAGIGERARRVVLQQIDRLALVEREHLAVVRVQRHIGTVNLRRPRVRGRDKGIPVLRTVGEVEGVFLRIDMQREVVTALRHRALRRDGSRAGVRGRNVGMVQRRRVRASRVRERASAVFQQVDGIAFAEGKELALQGAVAQRHIIGSEHRLPRVRGREERVPVFRVGRNVKGIGLRIDVQNEIFAFLLHRACGLDRRGAIVRICRAVCVVERRLFRANGICERADLVVQQGHGLTFVEGKQFVVVRCERHIGAVDLRRPRVHGGEERVVVCRDICEVERVRHAADGPGEAVLVVRQGQRAPGLDGGGLRVIRVGAGRLFLASIRERTRALQQGNRSAHAEGAQVRSLGLHIHGSAAQVGILRELEDGIVRPECRIIRDVEFVRVKIVHAPERDVLHPVEGQRVAAGVRPIAAIEDGGLAECRWLPVRARLERDRVAGRGCVRSISIAAKDVTQDLATGEGDLVAIGRGPAVAAINVFFDRAIRHRQLAVRRRAKTGTAAAGVAADRAAARQRQRAARRAEEGIAAVGVAVDRAILHDQRAVRFAGLGIAAVGVACDRAAIRHGQRVAFRRAGEGIAAIGIAAHTGALRHGQRVAFRRTGEGIAAIGVATHSSGSGFRFAAKRDGIAVRRARRRQAAGDESFRGAVHRDRVLPDIAGVAVRTDGAAFHDGIRSHGDRVSRQRRRIVFARSQRSDGVRNGGAIFRSRHYDRVPRGCRLAFSYDLHVVRAVRERCFCEVDVDVLRVLVQCPRVVGEDAVEGIRLCGKHRRAFERAIIFQRDQVDFMVVF